MFYVMDLESLVPRDHPLRAIKPKVDRELARLRPHFNAAYAKGGRPSIPPEQLIKATLLQALYTIRSERRLTQEIRYNFLYRWFLDLKPDASVWDHSTFTKNRARFAEHGLMRRFFEGSVAAAIQAEATSDDHFSVDGTLIESWASMKSFRPKDEDDDDEGGSNRWVNFQGKKRGNQSHESKTDPEARLARKGPGQGAKLCHSMHALMENRHGLVMDIEVAEANGWAEREAAEVMLARVRRRHWKRPKTLGADKGYDDGAFLTRLERKHDVRPHVATRTGEIKTRDEAARARRRARGREASEGYRASQRSRRRVEEIFGWLKTIGGMRKARWVGRWKIQDYAYVAAATFNMIRMAKIEAG
jgi:transposase